MRASHWHNALLVVDRQADQKEINTLQHYGDKSAEQNSIAAKSEIKMSHTSAVIISSWRYIMPWHGACY
jgi:hypothetical protein